jgi:hypothetical protein
MLTVLCGALGFAQNIPTNQYKQAANYTIAYYVKAYIEKKTDQKWRENAFQEEWPKLSKNSFEKPISQADLEAIINKLPKNKLEGSKEIIHDKTLTFYNVIKGKRDKEKSNIDELVKLDIKYENYLKDNGNLKKELQEKVSVGSENALNEGIPKDGSMESNLPESMEEDNTSSTEDGSDGENGKKKSGGFTC